MMLACSQVEVSLCEFTCTVLFLSSSAEAGAWYGGVVGGDGWVCGGEGGCGMGGLCIRGVVAESVREGGWLRE